MELIVKQITLEGCDDKMFISFFGIDEDFRTNEEYFREDTLALGYLNEAHRCSSELYNKHFPDGEYDGYVETLAQALEEGASYSVDGNQFILGNQTYTKQYDITLIYIDAHNDITEVIISYILI